MSEDETIYDASPDEADALDEQSQPMAPTTASTTALATIQPAQRFGREQLDLIKRTVAAGTSDDEFALFVEVCRLTGLNPFARQIYAIMRRQNEGGQWVSKMTIQTGIDGYRVLAARSGALAGIDDPTYDTEDGDHPNRASITVYRLVAGERMPFSATARWREYAALNKDGHPVAMWARMPWLMLGKVAEALALRRAFPAELSGVYTSDEMAQADNPAPQPAPARASATPAAPERPQQANHATRPQRQPAPPQRDAGRPTAAPDDEGETIAPPTEAQSKAIARLCTQLQRPTPVFRTFTEASRLITELQVEMRETATGRDLAEAFPAGQRGA